MAIIYKISNLINDKVYIGETVRSLIQRWQQHKNAVNDYNKKGHLQLAMRKYGIQNFYIEEIERCDDNIRFDREKYWINYYDSYNNGYNSTLGGEGSSRHDYQNIYELWCSMKTVQEICEIIGCCNTTVYNALKSYDIEYVDYINRKFARPVLQFSQNGDFIARYDSANAAGRALGLINGSNIIKCCKREIKTSKGFIWKYEDDPTPLELFLKEKKKRTTGKPVLQFSLEGSFIKEYESCEKAGKAIGENNGSQINRCARGERKMAHGYIWKYKDEISR